MASTGTGNEPIEPRDISNMTFKEIRQLTDKELEPIIRQGYQDLYGATRRSMSDQDLEDAIRGIHAGHWAYGLPTHGGSDAEPASIGL